MPEMQGRFMLALQSALDPGATLESEVAPGWLRRPGRDETGYSWGLVSEVYRELTAFELPEVAPLRERRRLDAIVTIGGAPRVVEFDENQHFTGPRLQTLSFYQQGVPVAFDVDYWRDRCRARAGKEPGGGFATPRPPLFPGEGGRHRQRAFRDFLADVLPVQHGWLPTARFEIVEVTLALKAPDPIEAITELWDSRVG